MTDETRLDLKSMNLTELEAFCREKGLPAFRAKQIYGWMHQKLVAFTEEMINLPKDVRAMVDEDFTVLTVVERYISEIKRRKL